MKMFPNILSDFRVSLNIDLILPNITEHNSLVKINNL